MTATPTPAERAQAKRLAYLHPGFSPGRVNAIAQALADVRGRYEAVADELEREAASEWSAYKTGESSDPRRGSQYTEGQVVAYDRAADRIRQVSQ